MISNRGSSLEGEVGSICRRRMRSVLPNNDCAGGFTLIELVLVVLLIGVFSGVLYKQVANYQERAEMAVMEQTAAAFRTGLQFRVAAYLLNRQPADLLELNAENPVNWLADKPSNYAGAFFGEPASGVKSGEWYFDLQNRTMVYVVWHREHFVAGADGYRIRFRARVDYGPILGADGQPLGVMGLRAVEFVPLTPYQWFDQGHPGIKESSR